MNQFGIDYDFPGLCALCHDEIANFDGSAEIFPGVFRPRITEWKHNKDEVIVRLDNGSMMRVSVCTSCKQSFTPDQADTLMTSVIRGWQREVSDIPHWDEEKKTSHMKEHSQKFIADRADNRWSDAQLKTLTKPDPKKIKDLKVK